MTTTNLVGPVKYSDGTSVGQARAGRLGDELFSELNGRYYEQAARGNTYSASSQAVATTTVGLATTYTGLCLSNPLGSATNLALLFAGVNQSIIQAVQIEAFLLATGSSPTANVTHTAAGTISPSLVGASANNSVAKVDTSATLPVAPVYALALTNTPTATSNAAGLVVEIAGAIVLAPGGYVIFATPGQASVAGMWFSLIWAEVPQ